jgi:hypothetical protein
VDTGIPADNFVNPPGRGNGLDTMDPGVYQVAMHPPLTPDQLAQLIGGQSVAKPVLGSPGGRGFASTGSNPLKP